VVRGTVVRTVVVLALVVSVAACTTVAEQAVVAGAGKALKPPAGAAPGLAAGRASTAPTTTAPTTTTTPVQVQFQPAPGAADARPDGGVHVAVGGGRLTSFTVNSAAGPVEGTYAGGDFTPAHPLGFGQAYTATATVVTDSGRREVRSASFSTLTPAATISAEMAPGDGATVGSGMPVIVWFSSPVPAEARATVASWFTVSSAPAVEGGWRWIDDSTMHWRPRDYWPAHTQVVVQADLAGHAAGDHWFTTSLSQSFATGEAHVITIDAAAHQMVAYENGQAVRVMPISTGRDAYPTASGIDLIMEKFDTFEMDSTSAGITGADAYDVTVADAQRLTNSGTFIHAAPWNSQLGEANISHGCVNASNADAAWMMDFTLMGDPVQIVNTAVQVEPWNGWGDWNVPFDQWPGDAAA
jgi:lipoprotein-anchoring transpeptidase ErfK/SrfK